MPVTHRRGARGGVFDPTASREAPLQRTAVVGARQFDATGGVTLDDLRVRVPVTIAVTGLGNDARRRQRCQQPGLDDERVPWCGAISNCARNAGSRRARASSPSAGMSPVSSTVIDPACTRTTQLIAFVDARRS